MFTGFEGISGQRWSEIKCRAKKKNHELAITIEDAWNQFIKQNELCALTGEKIYFGSSNSKKGTASLDRIDSSKGYIIDNIQWLHKDINIMKLDLETNYFIDLCKKVYNYSLCR